MAPALAAQENSTYRAQESGACIAQKSSTPESGHKKTAYAVEILVVRREGFEPPTY